MGLATRPRHQPLAGHGTEAHTPQRPEHRPPETLRERSPYTAPRPFSGRLHAPPRRQQLGHSQALLLPIDKRTEGGGTKSPRPPSRPPPQRQKPERGGDPQRPDPPNAKPHQGGEHAFDRTSVRPNKRSGEHAFDRTSVRGNVRSGERAFGGTCVRGNTRSTGPDRTGPDRTGPDRTGPDRTGPDRDTHRAAGHDVYPIGRLVYPVRCWLSASTETGRNPT